MVAGHALSWAQALHANGTLATLTVEEFLRHVEQVIDRPDYASSAADRLFTLRQGDRSVADYIVKFYLLAEETGWNEPALLCAFQQGLNRPIRDTLINGTRRTNQQPLVDRAVDIDKRRETSPFRLQARGSPGPDSDVGMVRTSAGTAGQGATTQ